MRGVRSDSKQRRRDHLSAGVQRRQRLHQRFPAAEAAAMGTCCGAAAAQGPQAVWGAAPTADPAAFQPSSPLQLQQACRAAWLPPPLRPLLPKPWHCGIRRPATFSTSPQRSPYGAHKRPTHDPNRLILFDRMTRKQQKLPHHLEIFLLIALLIDSRNLVAHQVEAVCTRKLRCCSR